jgi:acyl carrier protein
MLTEQSIFETIRKIVATRLEIDENRITQESNFRNDLQISSIVIVSVVLAIETEFDIEIADEEIVSIATVGDAVRFVAKKLQGRQAAAS